MDEPVDHVVSLVQTAYDLVSPVTPFALSHQGASNTSIGLCTGAGNFVWKTYSPLHTTESICYEHRLLTRLATADLSFAVPVPLPTRSGELLLCGPHGRASLTRCFPGRSIDPQQPAHAERYGAAIGELQAALKDYPCEPRPGRSLFAALLRFPQSGRDPLTLTPEQLNLPNTPDNADLLAWWREQMASLQAFVNGPYQILPQQVCHNDMAPANLLVDKERVSAVLDFEFATPAARALDVVMGLRMATRVWENPEPWEVISLFCRGYARWMTLTEVEIRSLPQLLCLRVVLPVVWWLGHDDDPAHLAIALRGIGYLRVMVDWLRTHDQRLVEVVMDATA